MKTERSVMIMAHINHVSMVRSWGAQLPGNAVC